MSIDFGSDMLSQANVYNPDTLNPYWYNGEYSPIYNQLDLSEIFHLDTDEKKHAIEGKITYMACDIVSDKESDLFLDVKKQMKCYQHLNGKQLHRIEVQGKNFYPIHLNKGINRYVVKAVAKNNDYSFESTVYDSCSVAKLYVNGQSNNIIIPEISPDSPFVHLTNDHRQILNSDAIIEISDVCGKKITEVVLENGRVDYPVNGVRRGHSYMCKLTIAGQSVNQPVFCGTYDEMGEIAEEMQKRLPLNSKENKEVDQILYRLKFLLSHESRKTDWWWQFKIAPLTYQIEHICFGDEHKTETAFNVQFKTYISELDGGVQRYLMAVPNNAKKGKKYPLVVVVRPEVENHHHFFTSPQFTHQWAINIMQEQANLHDMIVIMPEARMYHDEDVVPFANEEMKLAIADVKKHYDIDENRIYLHGICSGGYRAMHLATENPGIFAAIGLYAPTYYEKKGSEWEQNHSVSSNLHKLAGVPIMIFADPYDRHNPYSKYAVLIEGCRQQKIPLTFTQKINTELLYNCVIVGREAFDFFDGKKRTVVHQQDKDDELVIHRLYESPFVYVYNSGDKTALYKHMVDVIRREYEEYFFSKIPLVSDTEVTDETLATKNMFLIGDHFENAELTEMTSEAKEKCPALFEEGKASLSIFSNPHHEGKRYVVFRHSNGRDYFLRHPWINGTERVMKIE